LKTLFFGTPALAVPYLELLAQQTELKGVVTTPDEPAGRGYAVQATPVKQAAHRLNLSVLQPTDVKDPSFTSQLKAMNPDVVMVVAYGKILPPPVLQTAAQGFINVHFSLLPAFRGAAPIQRALMQGETTTGVTLFWLDPGMDTGPIFLQKSLAIEASDDAESLREKLIPLGVQAMKEALEQLAQGKAPRTPQQGAVTLAPSLKKEEGKIDWQWSATKIANLIRGTSPWPGAFTFMGDPKPQRLKILKAEGLEAYPESSISAENGTVVGLVGGRGYVVKCGQGFLHVLQVQPEGKRPMSAWDFWQGARLKLGEKLR
jgi:methionyl-tRNA formyltransferase